MKNEDLRDRFNSLGLTYSRIGSKEIHWLERLLKKELSEFKKDDPYHVFTMELETLRKADVNYEQGTLKNCFFMVRGKITPHKGKKSYYYFKRREAISFNTENKNGFGFIGFSGWSDSSNVQPFLRAFDKWIDCVIKNHFTDFTFDSK